MKAQKPTMTIKTKEARGPKEEVHEYGVKERLLEKYKPSLNTDLVLELNTKRNEKKVA